MLLSGRLLLWLSFVAFISSSSLSLAKPVILTVGDSLTFGLGVSPEQTWPALLQIKLRKDGLPEAQVINAGSSGATTAFGLATLNFHLKRGQPDLIIYALGANDGLRGIAPKTTAANINRALELIKSKGIKMLLLGMKAPPNYGEKFPKDFELSFTEAAAKFKVSFVPFFLADVAGHPELNQADGIHPTAEGYVKILGGFYPKIRELL